MLLIFQRRNLQVFTIRGSRRQNMMYRITRLRKMLIDTCRHHTTSIGGQPGGAPSTWQGSSWEASYSPWEWRRTAWHWAEAHGYAAERWAGSHSMCSCPHLCWGRGSRIGEESRTPQEAPDPTWVTGLAHLLLTNTLKKNSGAKMLWGTVSWHGEFCRHSHLGDQVQALMLQIMSSACQPLISLSTTQTLDEHQLYTILYILPWFILHSFIQ